MKTTSGQTVAHMPQPMSERWLEVDGQRVPYGRQAVYPSLASLSGHPATVFPVGLTEAGLPIGLQAIGPYLEDRTPIRFARSGLGRALRPGSRIATRFGRSSLCRALPRGQA